MHDLYSIYRKVKFQVEKIMKSETDARGNFRPYPNPPKMSDVEIISLSISAECLGIDSENLLFSKIKKDYSEHFPNLVHRTRYNKRKMLLREYILYCADVWSEEMEDGDKVFVVDSMPVPICKRVRIPRSTACRKESDTKKAARGYDSSIGNYFLGYRLHLIVSSSGVYQHCTLLPANRHDVVFLKELERTHLSDCVLIGDKAYDSHPLQLELFEGWGIILSSPMRTFSNRKRKPGKYPFKRKIQRKRIETVFSQYCDDFMMKRNYAKTFAGLEARIYSKIAGMTFKQYWNFLNGNKISRTKHALAA
jgi:hypothetical protein